MMTEYYVDGEKYYYNKGQWLSSNFTLAPLSVVSKLNKLVIEKMDFESKSVKELHEIIDKARLSENYQLAAQALESAIRKVTVNEIRFLLPKLTSNYRKLGRSQTAIDLGKSYIDKYKSAVWSSALFTSIAAAYCDIDDFENARINAKKARSMSGPVMGKELELVYERIENGMNCYRWLVEG